MIYHLTGFFNINFLKFIESALLNLAGKKIKKHIVVNVGNSFAMIAFSQRDIALPKVHAKGVK